MLALKQAMAFSLMTLSLRQALWTGLGEMVRLKKNILRLMSSQNENPITHISKSPLMATPLSFKELNSTVNNTT